MLYYTWTPYWVSNELKPGKDVVWLEVPFSHCPANKGQQHPAAQRQELRLRREQPADRRQQGLGRRTRPPPNCLKGDAPARGRHQRAKPFDEPGSEPGPPTSSAMNAWIKAHQKTFDGWLQQARAVAALTGGRAQALRHGNGAYASRPKMSSQSPRRLPAHERHPAPQSRCPVSTPAADRPGARSHWSQPWFAALTPSLRHDILRLGRVTRTRMARPSSSKARPCATGSPAPAARCAFGAPRRRASRSRWPMWSRASGGRGRGALRPPLHLRGPCPWPDHAAERAGDGAALAAAAAPTFGEALLTLQAWSMPALYTMMEDVATMPRARAG